jgi:hypothetical protein
LAFPNWAWGIESNEQRGKPDSIELAEKLIHPAHHARWRATELHNGPAATGKMYCFEALLGWQAGLEEAEKGGTRNGQLDQAQVGG